LVAGDDLVATFGFDGGVTGTFESMRSDDGGGNAYLRMEASGTAGTLAFWSGVHSPVYFCPRPFPLPDDPGQWQPVARETIALPPGVRTQHYGNQVLIRDLLAAVEEDRAPAASGHAARAALEMILAVYESHVQGRRVALPLPRRAHPLAGERAWAAARDGA
jgi:predicted dehydrogenase